MAANTHLSVASISLGLNAALDVLNGGFLEIYDGTQPASPDVAVSSQVKLAKLSLSPTAFGAASATSKTAGVIASASALATGTATWFRAFKSDDTTAVIDGSVGLATADLILNDVALTTGATVQVTSWAVSWPQ